LKIVTTIKKNAGSSKFCGLRNIGYTGFAVKLTESHTKPRRRKGDIFAALREKFTGVPEEPKYWGTID